MPKEKTTTRKTKARTTERRKKGVYTSFQVPRSWLTHVSDPNAPKRGLSAYMFFANENREKVREENPGISFGKTGDMEYASDPRCLTSL